jgi:hypothetical protein
VDLGRKHLAEPGLVGVEEIDPLGHAAEGSRGLG